MNDIAISARNVSKRYEVFDNGRARLLNTLWPGHRAGIQEVWALCDVDFEIRRGESVAVIGRNGGGKSTLLEILTGTLAPTTGEVMVNGRISALLELGSGFNPEYTGRENVMLNGLLLGLSRAEVLRRFDEILAFSEIGDAVERPVKTYSSGMVMRLAFAVQVLTDPDILVIDEALSVGDFFFQQKCFSYIRALRERGVTLLFVSHDMGTVRDLCSRAIYLKQGRVLFDGDSPSAIRHYFSESASGSQSVAETAFSVRADAPPQELPAHVLWRRDQDGDAGSCLLAVEVVDERGHAVSSVRMGETIRVRVYFRAAESEGGHISLVVKNRYDQIVSAIGTYAAGLAPVSSGGARFAVLQLQTEMRLEAGPYGLQVALGRPTGKNTGERLDHTGWLGPLEIKWDYDADRAPFLGMFGLPFRAEMIGQTVSGQPVATQVE